MAYVGSQQVSDFASETRKYGKTDLVVMRDIRVAPMIGIARMMSPVIKIDDPKKFHWEDRPHARTGTLQGDNGAGAAAALAVGTTTVNITSAADFIVAGDRLRLDCFDANNTNTSNVRIEGEIVEVATTPTSAVVTIIRNNGQADTTFNITAASGDTVGWELVGSSVTEGASPRVAKGYPLEEKWNALQYLQETFEATAQAIKTNKWGPDPYERDRRLKTQKMLWEMEGAFIGEHRREGTSGSRAKPTMGGL
jgi:hypothetical protein